ncbi:DUF5313 family protein [Gordonia sp. (in: high G+C Gram-positive bacteria)]|uniref:DUF5313 family protein n=1 Tax=Gordonia sp. (in: high G+C Gram-positive bacteria) TaxID=84139 RepID=UPI0039E7252E
MTAHDDAASPALASPDLASSDLASPADGPRPGPLHRLGYLLGRPLPDSMRAWVTRDITGPGNVRRYMLRGFVPFVPIMVGLCFIPAPWWVRIGMTLLLAIPLIYFQIALKDVYRRHLLRNNGLDPALADKVKVVRLSAENAAYERLHRPSAPTVPVGDGGVPDAAPREIEGVVVDRPDER